MANARMHAAHRFVRQAVRRTRRPTNDGAIGRKLKPISHHYIIGAGSSDESQSGRHAAKIWQYQLPIDDEDFKGERNIPLFPEVREVLIDAFEAADSGAEFVASRYGDATNPNLRIHLLRILNKAGVAAWPRLFNAMRPNSLRTTPLLFAQREWVTPLQSPKPTSTWCEIQTTSELQVRKRRSTRPTAVAKYRNRDTPDPLWRL